MSKIVKTQTANKSTASVDRRAVLVRLGLAAGAVYAAPVILQLSEARASDGSGGSGGGSGGGGRGSRGSRGSGHGSGSGSGGSGRRGRRRSARPVNAPRWARRIFPGS